MWDDLARHRFPVDTTDADAAKAAYVAHNEHVRRDANPERLVEWQPGAGWAPICHALGVDVPAVPFPHRNSTTEFNTAR